MHIEVQTELQLTALLEMQLLRQLPTTKHGEAAQ